MIGLAAVVEAVFASRGIYRHPADGIADGCDGAGGMIMMAVTAVAGVLVAAAAGSLWRAVSVGVFIVVHHSLRRL
jgi:hypothetical protein